MLAAARAEARKTCDTDLARARRLRDDAARARAELDAERKHQQAMKRIEAGNVARVKEARRASSRERRQESDDEVRGNIPPELLYLFERVKRQIKGSAHMSRTEAFLHYAEDHPDEELAALEDRTDALIAELEARERGETVRRNPKKAAKKRADAAVCGQEKQIHRLRSKVRTLEEKLAKRRNPRRPPREWWNRCLASVSAQRHAKDPAAVCGASWWAMPSSRRARIVRELEHGSPRDRRRAVAIAKAERNRHARHGRQASKPAKTDKRKGERPRANRRPNPLVPIHSVTYIEQKPGDRKPHLYEHEFEGRRPRLRKTDGKPLKIVRGNSGYSVRDGWIHD